MTYLSQFGGGSSAPVGSISTSLPGYNPVPVIDTGSQVFIRTGATAIGVAPATVSKVKAGTMPGCAVPATGTALASYGYTVYSGGIWLRTGGTASKSVMRSSDGTNWQPISLVTDTSSSWAIDGNPMVFGGVFYVAIALSYGQGNSTVRIYSSSDGLTWSYQQFGGAGSGGSTTVAVQAVLSIANSTLFCVLSSSGGTASQNQIYSTTSSSSQLMPVQAVTSTANDNVIAPIVYGASTYVYSGSGAVSGTYTYPIYSSDGKTWTQATNINGGTQQLKFLNSLFISVGYYSGSGYIYTSSNGSTWTASLSGATSCAFVDFDYGNSTYVAISNNGTNYYTSTNGTSWTVRTGPWTNGAQHIIYANSLFTVNSNNGIYTSPDGITWTLQLAGSTSSANSSTLSMSYDGTKLWASTTPASNQYVLYSSTNSTTWSKVLDLSFGILAGPYPTGGLVNGKAFFLPSSGGIMTWTPSTLTWAMTSTNAAVFSNVAYSTAASLWCAVGSAGTILTSPDGVTWTSQTSGTTTALSDVIYSSGNLIAVGSAVVRTSSNGTTWTTRTPSVSATNPILGAISNGTVIAVTLYPYSSAIMRSIDGGVTWTSTMPFPSISYFGGFKTTGDLFFFYNSTNPMSGYTNTNIAIAYDGLEYSVVGGNTSSGSAVYDVIADNSGRYHLYDSVIGVMTAVNKAAVMQPTTTGNSNFNTSQTYWMQASGSTPVLTPQSGIIFSASVQGPAGEILATGNSSIAMNVDNGYFFGYTVQSGLNIQYGTKLILDTNYLLTYYNGSVIFADRNNSLISGLPLISGQETWQPQGASTQYSAVPTYRRIA